MSFLPVDGQTELLRQMEELRHENAKLKGELADVATPSLPVSPATSGIPKSRGDTRQGYYHTIRSGARRLER